MSGSLAQLGGIGKADVETFIAPSVTFWKTVTKRHTQFAMEPRTIEFQGAVAWNRTCTASIPRVSDLLPKLWLVVELGALDSGNGGAYFTDDVGRAMFEEVKLDCGAVTFDRLFPELEHSIEELDVCKEKQLGMLTGKSSSVQELIDAAKGIQKLYVPLSFWFNNDYANALPLVALHLTDIKIQVKLRKLADLVIAVPLSGYTGPTGTEGELINLNLMAEFVFLDDPEREWFASETHKYIISQNQYLGTHTVLAGVTEAKVELILNHPTKELIFVFRKASNLAAKQYFNFSGEQKAPFLNEAFKTVTLKLNGNERLEKRDPKYFRVIQAQQHHARVPDKHVYMYSFALYPHDINPSGSINFSRIDSARLQFEFDAALSENYELQVYARSLNVANVSGGSCQLKYAS